MVLAIQPLVANFVTLIIFEISFFLIMTVFIWVGAKVVGIHKTSFLKALIASVLSVTAINIISLLFSVLWLFGIIILLLF